MAEIILSKGQKTQVDDKDYEWLNQWRWYLASNGYVTRVLSRKLHPQGKQIRVFMHRQILNPPQGYFTDHINGDKLDNRRSNLRVCTTQQNGFNRRKQRDIPKGVYYQPHYKFKKWGVYVRVDKKQKYIGGFVDKEDAIKAAQEAREKYHGEFAKW